MVLLNRKRIILFILILFVSIIMYFIYFGSSKNNIEEKSVNHIKNNVVDENKNIIENKTIILDAGHGAPDFGAQSNDGVTEAKINLNIVYKVKEKLENKGYNIVLTRENESGIYDDTAKTIREMKNSDLKNRVEIGNNSNADIFLSVHLNQIDAPQYWGWQTFFKKNSEESKLLAECVQKGISEKINRDNKRVALVISNKYLIDNVKIPITIVECGFLSNLEEASLLQTDEYQEKLASGIVQGIEEYFLVFV